MSKKHRPKPNKSKQHKPSRIQRLSKLVRRIPFSVRYVTGVLVLIGLLFFEVLWESAESTVKIVKSTDRSPSLPDCQTVLVNAGHYSCWPFGTSEDHPFGYTLVLIIACCWFAYLGWYAYYARFLRNDYI